MPDLLRSSVVCLLAAACARPARQTTPAERPPAQSNETRVQRARPDSTQEYRGEWDSGFETSTFRSCNGAVFSNVWLTLAPGATTDLRWPDENLGGRNTFTYYVRVRGILRGPADRRRVGSGYGHLGRADYELLVTRLLEVRLPGKPDCVVRR
jgi:hypothetical protein